MRTLACCMAMMLAGCGGAIPVLGQPRPLPTGEHPLREVAPQRAVPGQCVMALWTRNSPSTRILLATDNPALAHVDVNGRVLSLARDDARGAPSFGHYPEQSWSGDGVTVRLSATLAARDGMVGGVVVEDAALVFTDSAGSDAIIPVGGLVACQR